MIDRFFHWLHYWFAMPPRYIDVLPPRPPQEETMSHQHERRVCSCGQVILQCRCIGPKVETVVQNGCPACQARINNMAEMILTMKNHPPPPAMKPELV